MLECAPLVSACLHHDSTRSTLNRYTDTLFYQSFSGKLIGYNATQMSSSVTLFVFYINSKRKATVSMRKQAIPGKILKSLAS